MLTKPQGVGAIIVAGLVVPWVVLAMLPSQAPNPNRIAVPVTSPNPAALVAPNLANAPYFLLVEPQTQATRFLANPYADNGTALGMKAALLLLAEGVGTVIAPSFGPEARNLLFTRGVKLFETNEKVGAQAVTEVKNGLARELGPLPASVVKGQMADNRGGPPACVPCSPPPVVVAQAKSVASGPATAREAGLVAGAITEAPARAGSGAAAVGPTASAMTARGTGGGIAQSNPVFPAATPMSYPGMPAAMGMLVPSLGLQVGSTAGAGAQVIGVMPGSVGHWAGFRAGDRIVKFGQTEIQSAEQLVQLTSWAQPDRDFMVLVVRSNGMMDRLLARTGPTAGAPGNQVWR